MIKWKRAYEPPTQRDGYRVLVDRLWPRGLRKADAHVDVWLKQVAPSTELRKWFAHAPERFPEFRARYLRELSASPSRPALDELARRGATSNVTLLYAARDEAHNNAVVLARALRRRVARRRARTRRPARTRRAASHR